MAHPRHIPATSPLFCSWQPVVTLNLNFCTVNPSLSMKPRYFELAMRLFPIIPSANVMPYSEKIGRACARKGFPLLLFFSIAVRPLPRHGINPFLRTTTTLTTPITTTLTTPTTIATLTTLIAQRTYTFLSLLKPGLILLLLECRASPSKPRNRRRDYGRCL